MMPPDNYGFSKKLPEEASITGPYVEAQLAELHALDPGSERTSRLAFRPDGKMLVAAENGTTRVWTISSKE